MTHVVGVDGGGTRMRAVILDAGGGVLARAEREGAVVTPGAAQAAAEALCDTVREAADRAGVALPAAALWAGLAGAGHAAARTAVLGALAASGVAEVVRVGTDAEAAYHDAFGDGPGMLLIAGTGSIAWGRDGEGREVRVGGWGSTLGDEGSGYRVGLDALRAVVRAEDGRAGATALTGPVLGHCRAGDPFELVAWAESASKRDVAALVPLVVGAALAGDAAAEEILSMAVGALVEHVGVLRSRLADAGPAGELLLWGGLVAEGGPLRAAVTEAVTDLGVPVVSRAVDPPVGAARLALTLL